ncbi:MAG: LytTR family transcriptional regulator DNA-binding domain-containing protein [Anaerolineales bacterium]|jgi:ABC-2 type transport system ATP-binding protein
MIEFKRLQKVVDGNTVIDIDRLIVRSGEVVALVGPAGSGKRVLMDLLLGHAQPTAGTIHLGGVDPGQESERFSRQVGVLFAEDALYVRQTARANLLFHCRVRGLPPHRADEVLVMVGLVDHRDNRTSELPTGLARRLAFGRALLHDPEVLLLHEPFARCDEATIHLMGDLIQTLAEENKAVLVLADDSANLGGICDRIFALNQGHLVETYAPQAVEQAELPFKIPAKLEGSVALINPVEIFFADAEEGKAFLNTAEGRLPTRFTLSELEARLSRRGFFRAHRGYLVNLQHIREIIPFTRNSFSLRLDDEEGTQIPLSKSAAAELRELLGY